jgi:serine/threonine protein kinase
MTKSRSAVLEYKTALKYAHQEATLMYDLCARHLLSDYVTEVFGFAEGPLPDELIARVRLPAGDEGFCMVMRYEAGGSLEGLLYGRNLGMTQKLRLLTQMARAIAELHAVGVVHGDLKVCVSYYLLPFPGVSNTHSAPCSRRISSWKMTRSATCAWRTSVCPT